MQISHLLSDDLPTVVNYCDFTCYWNWDHFKQFVATNDCDGAIPAYRGFHPHSLGSTNYAYMRERDGWIHDIQEKKPFTEDRMSEFASSGTYYFSEGRVMKDAFAAQIECDLSVNGEFYASLAYKKLLESKCKVAVYPLQHFMQWGTPDDVREYNYWSSVFCNIASMDRYSESAQGSVVLPMAGLGKRFSDEGYSLTKPLLPISGKPMFVQALASAPNAEKYAFVLRNDMIGIDETTTVIEENFPGAELEALSSRTDGQATSAAIGLTALQESSHDIELVTFVACDLAVIYDEKKYRTLLEQSDVDVIVWVIRGYPNAIRSPGSFGWVEVDDTKVRHVSVKVPLNNPAEDPIVLGNFTFKRAGDFVNAYQALRDVGGTVNAEYYLDSCINEAIKLGLSCHIFEVDSYLCWGTPNDYETFKYWQSCFHKWDSHPYNLSLDFFVDEASRAELEAEYKALYV